MGNVKLSTYVKHVCNLQNIYDGMIGGLHVMPVRPFSVATAAVASGMALYLTAPESLEGRVSVIVVFSGLGWAATQTAHHIANNLWMRRLAQLERECQATALTDADKEAISNFLDAIQPERI